MLAGESAESLQAESSKLKAKKGNTPDLYFQLWASNKIARGGTPDNEIVQEKILKL